MVPKKISRGQPGKMKAGKRHRKTKTTEDLARVS